MKHKGSYIYTFFFVLLDLLTLVGTWVSAYYFRFFGKIFETPLGIPDTDLYFKLIPFILGIWLLVAMFLGMYRRVGLHQSSLRHFFDLVQGSVFFILGLIAFTYFYEEYRYSRLTLLLFSALLPVSLILSRVLATRLSLIYQLRQRKKDILLLASGKSLEAFISESKYQMDSRIIGVVIPQGSHEDSDRKFCESMNLKILKPKATWAEFFVSNPCESVVVALPHKHYDYLEANLDKISDQVPDIKIIPDVLKYTRFNTGIDMMGSTPVIRIHESPLTGLNCFVKRLTDILGASVALMIFAPAIAFIALVVPLTSRGPILYRQKRMGLDGKTFNCLKFRSMPVDAESKTGAIWAQAGDRRATPFGSFIRRTSLDELPQLLNVIKGDMSLVGPRPERPVFVNEFRKEVPGYMLRHKVKTGITGWAQVNGWRGSTSIEKRIECDLYYIQNWSFWLDVKILFMTVEEVLIGRNAY